MQAAAPDHPRPPWQIGVLLSNLTLGGSGERKATLLAVGAQASTSGVSVSVHVSVRMSVHVSVCV